MASACFTLWSIWIYQIGSENLLAPGRDEGLAERLVAVVRGLNEAPAGEREQRAHAMSSPGLAVHWNATSLVGKDAADAGDVAPLRRRLLELAPDLGDDGVSLAAGDNAGHPSRALRASLRLDDGSWVTVRADVGGPCLGDRA